MDWSKTKTIFIISFLILNAFLGYQLIQKRSSSQLEIIAEASIEEQFATEEITYEELPNEQKIGSYISGKIKFFTNEDIKGLKNQEVNIDNPAVIQADFKDPIKLPEANIPSKIGQIVKENLLYGEQYSFWKVDKDSRTITLFQTYRSKVIFNHMLKTSGMILLYLDENNEIVSYKQIFLDSFEEYEKENLISPLQTLEILFNNDHLQSGNHVSKIELGYFPLIEMPESQALVLTPTWHIIVDGKTDLYVNALEGHIIEKLGE